MSVILNETECNEDSQSHIIVILILIASIFNLQFAQVAPVYSPFSLENEGVELSTNSISLNTEELNLDFRQIAKLTVTPTGLIWRLSLVLNKPMSGHLSITSWQVPHDARLFIFNADQSYTGPYLSGSGDEYISGRFISGKLTLEYVEPIYSEFQGNFRIASILPDFIPELVLKENPSLQNLKSTLERPTIMLTGYWPPTNEMVRHFSQDIELNPGGWQGENWEGLGYDVVSFFPEFIPADCNDCGQGFGDLEVDYQDYSQDYWPIVEAVQPIAIMTFSRGYNDMSWELENRLVNRTNWYDDYTPPLLPTPNPPDDSVDNYHIRFTSLPVEAIITEIIRAEIGLDPYLDDTNAGMFLSEFAGYHGVWYKENFDEDEDIPCFAGGHIHVGKQVDWNTARQATEISLRALIAHVEQFTVLPGDCNGDGEVNILDIVALVNVVLGFGEFTPSQELASDLDGNGQLNILDIIAIVNLILGNN